jgi:hypothetical protein
MASWTFFSGLLHPVEAEPLLELSDLLGGEDPDLAANPEVPETVANEVVLIVVRTPDFVLKHGDEGADHLSHGVPANVVAAGHLGGPLLFGNPIDPMGLRYNA